MSLQIAFWVVAIIAFLVGVKSRYSPAEPAWSFGNTLILFVLILLLGWQVFGPALHR
jgi:membrane protein implicated in regulation of membrane protease activity